MESPSGRRPRRSWLVIGGVGLALVVVVVVYVVRRAPAPAPRPAITTAPPPTADAPVPLTSDAAATALQRAQRALELADLDAARRDATAALAGFEATADRANAASALALLGQVRMYLGEYRDAAAGFERAIALERELGRADAPRALAARRAMALIQAGQLDDADRVLAELGSDPSELAALARGWSALRRGQVRRARELLAPISTGAPAERKLVPWALWGLGEAQQLGGELAKAHASFEACSRHGQTIDFRVGATACRARLAAVVLAEHEPDLANGLAMRAVNEADLMGAQDEAARARLALARTLVALDKDPTETIKQAVGRAAVTEDPSLRIAVGLASATRDRAALDALEADARRRGLLALAITARAAALELDPAGSAGARAALTREADALGIALGK